MNLCQCGLISSDQSVASCAVPACRHKGDTPLAPKPVVAWDEPVVSYNEARPPVRRVRPSPKPRTCQCGMVAWDDSVASCAIPACRHKA